MKEKDTKFIVVPKGSFSYENMGELLNIFGWVEGNEIHFKDKTVPKDGICIEHGIITKIKSLYPDWKERFEFYSQEGEGKVRRYSIPTRNKCADEKKNLAQLKGILEERKKK